MAKYFNEYVETIKRNLGEPTGFESEIYEDCIRQGIRIFSRYRPRIVVTDISGVSGGTFDLTLPSTFIDGFSHIMSIEYPYESTNQLPPLLKENQYKIYRSPSAVTLRFVGHKLTDTDTARVTFTSTHSVDISTTTVSLHHEDAVANISTSIMAEVVATEFANVARSSLDNVAIDFKDKSLEWQIISDRYLLLFRKDLGIRDNDLEPVFAWTDLDGAYSFGPDYLTHPRSWR